MPKRLKKLSEEVVHANDPWFIYKHDTYELPNGGVGNYYYIETPGVAIVVPKMADGRIAMALQYRYLEDKQCISFPGGGIKEGDALEGAKRELFEETGCIADHWVKIGEFEPSTGLLKDKVHLFMCDVVEQRDAQNDETEQIEVIYRRPEEIEEMIMRNDIWDGQSIAAWAMVRHHLLTY